MLYGDSTPNLNLRRKVQHSLMCIQPKGQYFNPLVTFEICGTNHWFLMPGFTREEQSKADVEVQGLVTLRKVREMERAKT